MPRQELRPKPSGYKPSGRPFNELEQTPTQIGFSQPGTPAYRKFYSFAAKIFDAEAHHMVDLAYIDQMLYNAGFTTGAHNTVDFSEARQRIIQKLRDNGIDVGNVEGNIAPLSQKKPKYGKTGLAHKLTHDAYKAIPEADDSFLRTLDEDQFVSYLVEKTRQRKDYVVQALENKYTALMESHPELQGKSNRAIRNWIQDNPQEFGSLGDETLTFTRRNPPQVSGQPRGRVNIDSKVNQLFRANNQGYLGVDPIGAGVSSAANIIKKNPVSALKGGVVGIISDPEVISDTLKGDYQGAAQNAAIGTVTGALVGSAVKASPLVIQKGIATVNPVLNAAAVPEIVARVATKGEKGSTEILAETPKAAVAASLGPVSPTSGGSAANAPVDPERNNKRLEIERRSEEARQRGGRLSFGLGNVNITLPEFGLSELFEIN